MKRWRPAFWTVVAPKSRRRAFALVAAAAALMLIGSFLNFLNYGHYPIGRREVAVVLAALLAASCLVGLVAAFTSAIGRVVVATMLVFLAVDLNFDGPFALIAALFPAIMFPRISCQVLILLFGVVTISQAWMAALGSSAATTAPVATTLVTVNSGTGPGFAIVHVIMDEHIGLDAIPDSLPGGAEMRERLRTFYLQRAFRIFAGAYSENLHTVNAVPRMLGLGADMRRETKGVSGTKLDENPYFDALQAMGFHVRVVQNHWVNFCDHPAVASCATYQAGDPFDAGDLLTVPDKAALLFYRFATLSQFAKKGFRLYDFAATQGRRAGLDLPIIELTRRMVPSALHGMASLEDTIQAAHTLSPGEAIFAHLLVPHFPYAYDEACVLRPVKDWLSRSSPVSRERRYEAYFAQVRCVTHKVEELITAVESSPAAGRTVFIFHGDHGSRIVDVEPTIKNKGKFTEDDLVSGHGAFFAVAGPGIEPGYERVRYPLQMLLAALVDAKFQGLAVHRPDDFEPSIAIEDSRWNAKGVLPVGDLKWWQPERKMVP